MYRIDLEVCAWTAVLVAAHKKRHFIFESLSTGIAEGLAALDTLIPEAIDAGKLLTDRVTITFEFNPQVPRQVLIGAHQRALSMLYSVVAITPEVPLAPTPANGSPSQAVSDKTRSCDKSGSEASNRQKAKGEVHHGKA